MLFGWVEVIAVIASGMRPTPCLLAHVAGFSLGNESPSLPGEIYTPLVFHLPEASVFLIFSLSFYLRGISICTDLLLIP